MLGFQLPRELGPLATFREIELSKNRDSRELRILGSFDQNKEQKRFLVKLEYTS